MVTVRPLADTDLAAMREEMSAGKPVTVWFTPTAVGVPAGGSAKVTAIGEPAEGEFIEVRPTGSRDTMPCSPNELTRVRPPRKRAPAAAASPTPTVASPTAAAPSTPAAPAPPGPATAPPRRAASPAAAGPAPTTRGRAVTEAEDPPAPSARKGAPRRRPAAEVTVTLAASAEGDWSVEVLVGKKRLVRSLPVQPSEVAKAARSLPAPVTEAIEASLAAARDRQAERVQQLRAELEAAQQALRDLSG
jgi:hypothetical protein